MTAAGLGPVHEIVGLVRALGRAVQDLGRAAARGVEEADREVGHEAEKIVTNQTPKESKRKMVRGRFL